MKENPNLYALMEGLIDYAGLFPPANLALKDAIAIYAKDIQSDDAWMLGPFILPIDKLCELQAHSNLFMNQKKLTLSLTGKKSATEEECAFQLDEDLKQIFFYQNKYREWARVAAIEIPLPSAIPTKSLLQQIADGAKRINAKTYCELTLLNNEDWRKQVDEISEFNQQDRGKLGVKLRTGGIEAKMFPSTEKVASVVSVCVKRKIPLKFTAGLHHPIRMYREEVNTKMHGFLNIFMAGMIAYKKGLGVNGIEEVIIDENSANFILANEGLGWKDTVLQHTEIKWMRENLLCSFGSCSFDEPRMELLELSNRKEVIK